ncbi:hypothetical protein [Kitasatospora fiedleri]|uniref:hypothetical protein n=1 Tax=Kitasatospora fiedleri TaxID=2991545 RepID=UPI00249CDDD0|nr:hypothetical protein [Kitasatospora fiedleri]
MALPNLPQDILDRLAALEGQVRDLSGRVGQRPAQTQIAGGDVSVYAGGSFRMLSFDGAFTQAWIGRISPNHPDGSEQRGILVYREDGSLALSLYSSDTSPQALALRDKAGTTVLADDVQAGGLARPYLSTDNWVGATQAPTYTTSSATFTGLQTNYFMKQHPKVTANYRVQTSAGTTGEIRMIDEYTGTVVVPPISIAAAAFFDSAATGTLTGTHEQALKLVWQARVTAGAGTIGVMGLSTYGVQS